LDARRAVHAREHAHERLRGHWPADPDVDRAESGLNAGWTRRAGERGSYTVGANATRVRYGDTAFGYSDYDYAVFQAGYTLSTGTRSSWRFGASQSVVQTLDTGVEQRSTSVSATWTHVFSPELTVSLGLGAFDVSRDLPGPLASDPPRTTWRRRSTSRSSGAGSDGRSTRAARATSGPTGAAGSRVTIRWQVNFDRRVTQRLTVGASLLAARNTDTFLPTELASRDYGQAGIHARLSVGQRWSVSWSVDERVQVASFWPRASGTSSQIAAGYRGR